MCALQQDEIFKAFKLDKSENLKTPQMCTAAYRCVQYDDSVTVNYLGFNQIKSLFLLKKFSFSVYLHGRFLVLSLNSVYLMPKQDHSND